MISLLPDPRDAAAVFSRQLSTNAPFQTERDTAFAPLALLVTGAHDQRSRLLVTARLRALGRLAPGGDRMAAARGARSEEHTSELQSLMRTSYAVFCLKKKKTHNTTTSHTKT